MVAPAWVEIDGIYAEIVGDDGKPRNVAWLSIAAVHIYQAARPPTLFEFRDAVLAKYPEADFWTYRRTIDRGLHREAWTAWEGGENEAATE